MSRGLPVGRVWRRPPASTGPVLDRTRAGYALGMELIVFLILLALNGLFVGALARLALPGRDPMTVPQTIGVGMAGSFAAGIVLAIIGAQNVGGWLLSLVFAAGIVYLVRRSRGGDLTHPA